MKNILFLLISTFISPYSLADYRITFAKQINVPEEKATGSAFLYGDNTGKVFSVDETGSVQWEKQISGTSITGIAANSEKYYIVSNSIVYIIDKNGENIKSIPLSESRSIDVDENGLLYIGGKYGRVVNEETEETIQVISSSSIYGGIDYNNGYWYYANGRTRTYKSSLNDGVILSYNSSVGYENYDVAVNDNGYKAYTVTGSINIRDENDNKICSKSIGGTDAYDVTIDNQYAYATSYGSGYSSRGAFKIKLSDCTLVWKLDNGKSGYDLKAANSIEADSFGNVYVGLDGYIYKINNGENLDIEWQIPINGAATAIRALN